MRLPSGRQFFIDRTPLSELCRKAFENLGASALLFLDKLEHLFPYLLVVPTFEPNSQSWRVSEVLEGKCESWSVEDVEALRYEITAGSLATSLQHELNRIIFVRGLLTDCAIMQMAPHHKLPFGKR